MPTLSSVLAAARAEKKISLRSLGVITGVTAQYIHDIERDRRIPSPRVLAGLAEALGLDAHRLLALAGKTPAAITSYMAEHPEATQEMTSFFEKAREHGFVRWSALTRAMATLAEEAR